jgi:hypothetical protein
MLMYIVIMALFINTFSHSAQRESEVLPITECSTDLKQSNDDHLKTLINKLKRTLSQTENRWNTYKCSNLYTCTEQQFATRFNTSVSDNFSSYTMGLSLILAGTLFFTCKSLSPYSEIVVLVAGVLLSSGMTSCKSVCQELNMLKEKIQATEEELLSRITCPLQYIQ